MSDIARLLDILGIKAKRRGREWEAPCPVHHDTDPSWHIEDETGRWYCFGCTQGGSVVFLIEKLKGLDRKAAEMWLSENGITNEQETRLDVPNIVPIDVGVSQGFKPPSGATFPSEFDSWNSVALQYALGRGISHWQIRRWSLGYAVSGRLENRIIFPCIGHNGRMVGYSARTFVGATPRYLTPAPNENPDLTVMFGECHWGEKDCVVVTEGAINALACERAGAKNIAALSGSPLSPLDIAKGRPASVSENVLIAVRKLSQFDRIVMAVDPDKAGDKVFEAVRALGRWKNVSRVEIPPGNDAATLPRADLRARLADAGCEFSCAA